jgi:hypothetical protein
LRPYWSLEKPTENSRSFSSRIASYLSFSA